MSVLLVQNEPPLLGDHKFEQVFDGTVHNLNEILHSSYVVGKDNFKGPLGRMLKNVISYHRQKLRYARDWEAFRIGSFAMKLEDLSKSSPGVFAHFRRKLRRISNEEYFGIRWEIEVAHILLSHNIDFLKREAPDFAIPMSDGDTAFIECASTNLKGPREKDVIYKIISTLHKKAAKPYCNGQTALFIDFTNVFYNSALGKKIIDLAELAAEIKREAKITQFGAVLVYDMINDLDKKQYALGCAAAVINDDAGQALRKFLDQYFTKVEHKDDEVRHSIPYSL